MSNYFKILDKDLIGRQDGMFDCHIFHPGEGWKKDTDNVLMDRIVGYDEDGIGNSDMMSRLEEITEEEANKLIKNM